MRWENDVVLLVFVLRAGPRQVLDGLFQLANRLFDVEVVKADITPPLWDSGMRKTLPPLFVECLWVMGWCAWVSMVVSDQFGVESCMLPRRWA